MRYFTSDTHFGHTKVIEYCRRPFASVEEMDAEMIRRWNERVKPEDEIYVLGDFCWRGPAFAESIIKQLLGKKYLVMGNHDMHIKRNRLMGMGFSHAFLPNGTMIHISNIPVLLSHFPFKGFEDDDRKFHEYQYEDDGGWLLHGHVHCAWKQKGKMINVGVDQWNYAPVSEAEISALIGGK